jgi:molecular chaperone GrpE
MSEPASPGVAGNAPGDRQETLTPESIETILGDFRAWLQEAACSAPVTSPPAPEPIDLHTLLGQFLALRHEVNLQTKAVRSQQEQNAETLRQLSQAVEAVRQAQAAAEQAKPHLNDELVRPVLKTLVDIADALLVAEREVRRVTEEILPDLDRLAPVSEPEPARPSFWARLFGRRQARPADAQREEQARQTQENLEHVQSMLGSLLTGYTMSLQRVERALEQHELERILCVGGPFDPEQMEVVEVVANSGRDAGEVVEEVRRGYLWRGRVFRYAQVRVARDSV